jgi:hypothetical protein
MSGSFFSQALTGICVILAQSFRQFVVSTNTTTHNTNIMAHRRVYLENLSFSMSRRDLEEAVVLHGNAQHVNCQIIRKGSATDSSWTSRMCSAIFSYNSQEEAEQVVYNLNTCDFRNFMHVLAPGCTSLRAKLAYPERSRSVAQAKADSSRYWAQLRAASHDRPNIPVQPKFPPPTHLINHPSPAVPPTLASSSSNPNETAEIVAVQVHDATCCF